MTLTRVQPPAWSATDSHPTAPIRDFAFGLDTDGRAIWLGDYEISADDLLHTQKKQPENQFAKARRLIDTALAHGPVAAAEMEQKADEQGISPKTLQRAKSALGVVSLKRGGRWYWQLPFEAEFSVTEDENQDGHDGQTSPMTVLTILAKSDAGDEDDADGADMSERFSVRGTDKQQGQRGHDSQIDHMTVSDERKP